MTIFNDDEGFYTQREVCRLLRLSRQTIYRWRKRKLFPEPAIFVVGGALRWYIAHVHEWIRENLAFLAQAVATGRNVRSRQVAKRKKSEKQSEQELTKHQGLYA
ncbi:helix-turn-helix transcriptional regulator [Rhizobium leguminosarum]